MLLIDGGDLACGELLMLVYQRVQASQAGTVIGIATRDPAAAIDIPAWCHLTGHRYLGRSDSDGHGPFLVELMPATRLVDPNHPWHPLP